MREEGASEQSPRAAGDLLYMAALAAPQTFPEPFPGTATGGFVFRLDTEQAAEAQAFFDDPDNRIGLAAAVNPLEIPTLGEIGVALLGLLTACAGVLVLRRF